MFIFLSAVTERAFKRQILNLLIVWGLTGLWHGAAYNFVLWGLYYGLLLILEKFVLKKFLDRLPSLFSTFTLCLS